MRLLVACAATGTALLVACSSAPATPTAAPPPPTLAAGPKPAASPVLSPAVASPVASAAPASSPGPITSPAASPAASPLAVGSPVAIPQMMLSGTPTPDFTLESSAFNDGDTLPTEFTCAGAQTSPPLQWSGAPATTRAFSLVEQDMDVPPPNGPVVHWLIYNIPGSVTSLQPGLPQVATLPNGAMQGVNALRSLGSIGSCPPVGAAPHHYVFQLFATDAVLAVQPGVTIVDFAPALEGHIVAQTELRAMFGR